MAEDNLNNKPAVSQQQTSYRFPEADAHLAMLARIREGAISARTAAQQMMSTPGSMAAKQRKELRAVIAKDPSSSAAHDARQMLRQMVEVEGRGAPVVEHADDASLDLSRGRSWISKVQRPFRATQPSVLSNET